jgi:hypothetical protein
MSRPGTSADPSPPGNPQYRPDKDRRRPRDQPEPSFWQEALSYVSAGRFVSTAAARAAHYFSHPGITYVPYHDAPPIEYGLLWPTAAENTRMRAFVHIVRDLTTPPRA